MSKRAKPSERGFTLLEVLVAFAIASLGLMGLFRSSSAGLGNVAIAGRTIEATGLAQAMLATIGQTAPLVSGTATGAGPGDYTWQSTVTLDRSSPPAAGGTARTGLYRVEIVVAWPAGRGQRTVGLSGYRTAPDERPRE